MKVVVLLVVCLHAVFAADCQDRLGPEKEISGGKVFALAGCKRYIYTTKQQAQTACAASGATLATLAQLTEAWKGGLSHCRCGWLADESTAKFPIVGPSRPGCMSGDKVNTCPSKSMGKWGGPGWNAFCFTACQDKLGPEKEINGGRVFALSACERYTYASKEQAQAACAAYPGATLATLAQLTEAWKAGLDHCRCGWLADQGANAKYPIVGPKREGCGKSGDAINTCPARGLGKWGGRPGWDAWCFTGCSSSNRLGPSKAITGGTVYALAAATRYAFTTKEQAQEQCEACGGTLATLAQLTEAWKGGLSHCRCGWLADESKAKFPIAGPSRPGCMSGDKVNTCPSKAMGKWGGPGWNAWCFR